MLTNRGPSYACHVNIHVPDNRDGADNQHALRTTDAKIDPACEAIRTGAAETGTANAVCDLIGPRDRRKNRRSTWMWPSRIYETIDPWRFPVHLQLSHTSDRCGFFEAKIEKSLTDETAKCFKKFA